MSIRSYADTSVYGGLHDEEFAEPSRRFFEQVRSERFALLTSAVVDDELEEAPPEVQSDYEALLPFVEIADVTDEALALQKAYLNAKILTPKWEDDALHIALATVHPTLRTRKSAPITLQ